MTQSLATIIKQDPQRLGQLLADSGYFSDARGAAQAAVKVMAGAELGFPPIQSMMGVYIVKGKVTLSANLMAAAIKRHPRYTFRVKEHSNDRCVIDFIEDGEVVGTSEFTMDDAKTAGLTGSQTWRSFPKNMLYARALSNGAKWYCPDVFGGPMYTPDELGAEVDGETGEMIGGDGSAVPTSGYGDLGGLVPERKPDIPADWPPEPAEPTVKDPQVEAAVEGDGVVMIDAPFASDILADLKRQEVRVGEFRQLVEQVGATPPEGRLNRESMLAALNSLTLDQAIGFAKLVSSREKAA